MSISNYDQNLFKTACDNIIGIKRERNGIGTLQEKTVHAVLKNFYEPDPEFQEIHVEKFVADILREDEIIEIQTRNLNAMRKKLDTFLKHYPVTIVHPIVHTKWLLWIDEKTGEISNKRKSPKKGTYYDAFFELYKIKPFLTNPNLHICLVLIDAEEYRLLNGWSKDRKRGSVRYDRIPVELVDELYIGGGTDYCCLIPDGLPKVFTTKDFAKQANIAVRYAGLGLNILKHVGAVNIVGKDGHAYLYSSAAKNG